MKNMKNTYKTQKEKIISGTEEYLKIGQNKGYFVVDGNKIKYLAKNKKYSFINSKEKNRAKYYFDLIEKYKYPPEKIYFEVELENKNSNKLIDIIVYDMDDAPYIIVKCAKNGIPNKKLDEIIKQTIANAKILKAKFAVILTINIYKVIKIDNKNIITDIPVFYNNN